MRGKNPIEKKRKYKRKRKTAKKAMVQQKLEPEKKPEECTNQADQDEQTHQDEEVIKKDDLDGYIRHMVEEYLYDLSIEMYKQGYLFPSQHRNDNDATTKEEQQPSEAKQEGNESDVPETIDKEDEQTQWGMILQRESIEDGYEAIREIAKKCTIGFSFVADLVEPRKCQQCGANALYFTAVSSSVCDISGITCRNCTLRILDNLLQGISGKISQDQLRTARRMLVELRMKKSLSAREQQLMLLLENFISVAMNVDVAKSRRIPLTMNRIKSAKDITKEREGK